MKALVLAAGRGSRLGKETDESNKCMLPMFGKPLVQYSLENAAHAGVDEIVVVVGYRAETVINAFGIDFNGIRVQYVIQDEPAGLVHAIETARDAIDGADFMPLRDCIKVVRVKFRDVHVKKYFCRPDDLCKAQCGQSHEQGIKNLIG